MSTRSTAGWAVIAWATAAVLAVACGTRGKPDNDVQPVVDANSSTPGDAAPTPDASEPDASEPDASARDSGAGDGGAMAGCGPFMDDFEPNDGQATAVTVAPTAFHPTSWVYAEWMIYACTSGGNEDWYRIPASTVPLMSDPDFDNPHAKFRFTAKNSDVCQDPVHCGSVILPEGPEHTVFLEVMTTTGTLLASTVDTRGVVSFNLVGPEMNQDFFVRIYGPALSLYDYNLYLFIDSQGAEDECEC